MTGRTCPVHGEYSETGVCRWCEPLPAPDARPPLPEGHTRCRCGWMAWTEYARKPLCEERNGMVHTPEQCYATAATPPVEALTAFTWEDGARVCNVDATTLKPGTSVFDAMVEGWARIVRARIHDDMAEARYFPFDATRCSPRLLAQHAALRWERVARRWNWKHRGEGGLDEEGRARVWMYWLEQQRRLWEAESWTMLDLAKGWGTLVNEALRENVEKLTRSNPLLPEEPQR